MYQHGIKRMGDFLLSSLALLILWPIFLILAVAIKLDDPGPVFFRQKRVGLHKEYFWILKFRTMKMCTPHDMPTHLLEHPEQYITRVGNILRKTSLDELPQILQIWTGKMSIIGPRPALWNQYDLIELRDQYGANDIRPGLSGWAQINGRDELPIEVKARYDGEYVEKMSFLFDCKCFFGTIFNVKIWIFNNYNELPSQGGLNRHYFFARQLQKLGHEPVVFVGSHPHNTHLQMIEGKESFRLEPSEPFPWVYVKTVNYEGSKLKRVFSMFQYYHHAKKAALALAKQSGAPDAVLGSSAHPLAAVLAIRLGKRFGCKSIAEVRDLWPESIVAYGIAGPRNPAVLALRRLEKWI